MKTDSDTTGDTVITCLPVSLVSVGRGETVTLGCHGPGLVIIINYLLISGVSRPGNDHLQFYLHNLAANYNLDTFTYDTRRHITVQYSTKRQSSSVQYSTVQFSHPCLCPEPCIVVTGTLGMLL